MSYTLNASPGPYRHENYSNMSHDRLSCATLSNLKAMYPYICERHTVELGAVPVILTRFTKHATLGQIREFTPRQTKYLSKKPMSS